MSIIIDLYTGNIDFPGRSVSKLPGWQAASDRLCAREEALSKTLTKSQRGQLERLMNSCTTVAAIEEQDAFREGFRLGARIMREIYEK